MKVLLIFVPQWTPVSIHFAIPSLAGQLISAGFDATALDLNIDFYESILNKPYLTNAILRAVEGQEKLLNEIKTHYKPDKTQEEYPLHIRNKLVKYAKIKEIIQKKSQNLVAVPDLIEDAIVCVKDEDNFYKPEKLIKSLSIIDSALEFASMPYFPSKISLDSYTSPFFKLDFDSIKYFVFDRDTNIFEDYYKSIVEKIKSEKYEYIGISINSSSQIIPGLTLAYMLKNNTDSYINIGGNFFGRVADTLVQKKEFFDLFCDSVLVEEGEKSVVELAQYINGELPIEKVSNLIYVQDNKIHINKTRSPLKLNEMKNVSLNGYDLKKYFAPEIVFPFQSSRGCYWGKCSFCDQDFGQNFNVKDVKKLISDIKEMKEKYNITSFEFIDESVSPSYLEEMSKAILSENLDIKYFFDARLENTFTYDVLKQGYDSGLRMILWGLESGSEDVMKLINKGIDIDKRLEILKNSSDAGIWNFAFIFFGFPTETYNDAMKTIELLCSNTDIVHSYGRSVFTMGKHTKLKENPSHYGITKIYPADSEFSPSYSFDSKGMSKNELNEVLKICTEKCKKQYNNPLWMYLRYREYIFLYLTKYDRKHVSEYKLNL